MTLLPFAVVLVPLLGALTLGIWPSLRRNGWALLGTAALTFALTLPLPFLSQAGTVLLVDGLSALLSVLTALIAVTSAWFSRWYMATASDEPLAMRHYDALFLALLGFMLGALLSNNLGIAWVALEAATMTGVIAVGLPRTPGAVEAAWKYFVVCGVGIALALLGVVVLYLAALPATGPGFAAMSWSTLASASARCHGPLLNLSFVLLLAGYGTKASLAPLHSWMPDAHAEGPTPLAAVLAGSLLNVALAQILRMRGILAGNGTAIDPGGPLLALGLVSVLAGAFGLWRRGDVKRFFALSTMEQNGLITVAFGLGGPAATFAGLLHMTLHTMSKAAVFCCVGAATRRCGGQRFVSIHGLLGSHRALALTLGAAILAIAAVPPSGLFTSTLLVLTAAIRQAPVLALLLAAGLLVGAWALLARLLALCAGPAGPSDGPKAPATALTPAWVLLALVAGVGVLMPPPFASWLRAVAETLR